MIAWRSSPDGLPRRKCQIRLELCLFRNLGSLLARFRQANRDCLLATFHLATFSAFTGTKRPLLPSPHCTLNCLCGRFTIFPAAFFPARSFPRCHVFSFLSERP